MSVESGLADVALDRLEHLLQEMRASGIGDPAHVVREAVAAGEAAWRFPLIALAAGADPLALLWARDVRMVLGLITVPGSEAVVGPAVSNALDVLAFGRALAAGG